jgi:uncharacterized protein
MRPGTRTIELAGPAGPIDVAIDLPPQPARAVALIAHPHPLFGGTRDNKVVQTLARALLAHGCACWRPNFRGVGGTAGGHDEGRGETDDLVVVCEAALADVSAPPAAPLVLAGFSFGSFVQARVAQRLADQGRPARRLILVGTATNRFDVQQVPGDTIVIHGEVDETVPLSAVLDWARPQQLPIVVIPGADHFFHRKLTVIKELLVRELVATLGPPVAASP